MILSTRRSQAKPAARFGLSATAAIAAIVAALPARAADDNWSNPAASYQQWTTGSNWDLGTAPTGAQTTAIANNGWATINSAVAFNSLTIGGSSRLQLTDGANLSGGGVITNNSLITTQNSSTLTVSNAIGGSGGLAVGGSGTFTLAGVNSYSGTTTIASGSTLAMSGSGTIVNTSVNVTGTLDISQVTSGSPGSPPNIDIKNLTGSGTVALGANVLTLSAASGTFSGVITDGGIAGGTGGVLGIRGGTLTLTGVSTFHGQAGSASNASLVLAGNGSIANAWVSPGGTGSVFDISQTYSGATIAGLGNSGTVALGSKTLTIAITTPLNPPYNFIGEIKDGGIAGGSGGGLTLVSGLQILGNSSYTGLTTISGGTLAFGGSAIASSSGVVDNGTLDISLGSATIKTLSGSGIVALGRSTLTLTAASGTFSGTIQDGSVLDAQTGGGLAIAGGSLTLTGANTYTGGTTISAGTLQLGPGGSLTAISALAVNGGTFDLNGHTQTVGPLSGTGGFILLGSGALTTDDTVDSKFFRPCCIPLASNTLASVIGGSGSLTKAGPGTLTLTAVNTYTGGTTITGGRLNVAGTIAAVSVASGGTLMGTGNVGTTSVASGGTLSPGTGAATGTLTVAGNLALASGANYVSYFGPAVATLTTVSGTASINGVLTANAESLTYTAGQRYTLITAAGGLSGSFASFTTPNLPAYVTGRLSYDANNVFLNLDANDISSSLGDAAPTNQTSVTTALDTAVKNGKAPNSGIASLFSLSGASLGTALNQATGEIGAKASQAAGQSFSPFFNVLMSRGETNDAVRIAGDGMPSGVRPAQLTEGAMNVWGSIYGGHTSIAADAASGTAALSSGAFGLAVGLERMFSDEMLVGASMGVGHQSFRSGGGGGKSDDVMLGLYGRKNFHQAYVAAAIGYGWHDIATTRTVTISGTDVLGAKFTAHDLAGRIEGGYRLALNEQLGITPFAAFAGDVFHTPAYAETNRSGSANFALSYAASDSTVAHSEFGGRFDRDFAVDAQTLSLEALFAWAHQLNSRPSAQAAFQDLPGSGFVLLGVKPADDTALLGLGLQMHDETGLVYGAHVQEQTGGGTDVISGTLNLAYHW
jgi:autotransporter-associated beta strand protein